MPSLSHGAQTRERLQQGRARRRRTQPESRALRAFRAAPPPPVLRAETKIENVMKAGVDHHRAAQASWRCTVHAAGVLLLFDGADGVIAQLVGAAAISTPSITHRGKADTFVTMAIHSKNAARVRNVCGWSQTHIARNENLIRRRFGRAWVGATRSFV